MKSTLKLSGHYKVEHWRGDKLLKTYEGKNLIVNEGINFILDLLGNNVALTEWYVGLVQDDTTEAIDANTTGADIGTDFTEFTDYTGNRQLWLATGDVAASKSLVNSAVVTFPMTGSGTIWGIFIVDAATGAGSGVTMWAGTAFSTAAVVVNGDNLKVTYTVNGADA